MVCARLNHPARPPDFLNILLERTCSNLDSSQRVVFSDFLCEFQDVFSENIVAGNCHVLEHKIELCDSHPIKQVPRRIPLHLRAEVNKIVEDMKTQHIIEESNSTWMSPAVMVKRKDVAIRFCVDYRKVNAITKRDFYPLPRIERILDRLAGNSWFSTLDLKSGYWQVSLACKDRKKTAFSIGEGL